MQIGRVSSIRIAWRWLSLGVQRPGSRSRTSCPVGISRQRSKSSARVDKHPYVVSDPVVIVSITRRPIKSSDLSNIINPLLTERAMLFGSPAKA